MRITFFLAIWACLKTLFFSKAKKNIFSEGKSFGSKELEKPLWESHTFSPKATFYGKGGFSLIFVISIVGVMGILVMGLLGLIDNKANLDHVRLRQSIVRQQVMSVLNLALNELQNEFGRDNAVTDVVHIQREIEFEEGPGECTHLGYSCKPLPPLGGEDEKATILSESLRDWHVSRMGLQTNPVGGGLKKDFLAFLKDYEREEDIFTKTSDFPSPPRWSFLKDFCADFKREVDPFPRLPFSLSPLEKEKPFLGKQLPSPKGVYPILTDVFLGFRFSLETKVTRTGVEHPVNLHYLIGFDLWNPYSVALAKHDYLLKCSSSDGISIKIRDGKSRAGQADLSIDITSRDGLQLFNLSFTDGFAPGEKKRFYLTSPESRCSKHRESRASAEGKSWHNLRETETGACFVFQEEGPPMCVTINSDRVKEGITLELIDNCSELPFQQIEGISLPEIKTFSAPLHPREPSFYFHITTKQPIWHLADISWATNHNPRAPRVLSSTIQQKSPPTLPTLVASPPWTKTIRTHFPMTPMATSLLDNWLYEAKLVRGPEGWGSSPSYSSVPILFEPPHNAISSLGALQHANLTPFGHHPSYAIGNSLLPPFIPYEKTETTLPVTLEGKQRLEKFYDYSYLLNQALWDDFFVSKKILMCPMENYYIPDSFNVNSPDPTAWKKLLSRGQKAGITTFPHCPSDPDSGLPLDSSKIQILAEEIVKQVERRKPFKSLAEFVNRKLIKSPMDLDDTLVKKGAVQGAIDNAEINDSKSPMPPKKPSLTQADILQVVGPFLTVKDDTFSITIKKIGQKTTTLQTQDKEILRAIVQRTPEYVDPSDKPETPPTDLKEINKKLGRRFKIVSLQWSL